MILRIGYIEMQQRNAAYRSIPNLMGRHGNDFILMGANDEVFKDQAFNRDGVLTRRLDAGFARSGDLAADNRSGQPDRRHGQSG
ncbi:hypothetical protein NOVOSPHI9U_650024 [Novosphingobium sp. 9U]|nr:hypothetical protein NOVOSPHI9U_650024 [Novosphingobium sp. 9U]